jgi:NAD(P)H-quinone oxidoreductase subunit 5
MDPAETWSLVVRSLALAVPVALAIAGLAAPRRATIATGAALSLAFIFTLGAVVTHGAPPGSAPSLGVHVDVVVCIMLLLVAGIGLVIARYSQTYLHGAPGGARYFRWLLLTLAAVTSLVIANNLLVIAIAWTTTSLALHQLLTFYPDRPAALVAAHKKFLVSRLADGCLWSALALVQASVGSLDLDRIAAWASGHPALTPAMHLAAVLVVITVALKSAQLPFHGWLTQVMEAPTPVSALLHAGIVNIGGFVMIQLAPWMARSAGAQLLLVGIGLTTTVVAALVMTTRVSVKVALAWSTCAQMGFMLVECGLGAWHLALLHLVAHSLYKAHAFLSAGTAVEDWRRQALRTRPPQPTARRIGVAVLAMLASAALTVIVASQLSAHATNDLDVPVIAFLVALAMVPLVARTPTQSQLAIAARVVGVVFIYVAGHTLAGALLPAPPPEATRATAWLLVGVGFAALFVVKATLALRPDGRLARTLHPWLFAGLYLDELFTRLTFRVWPPRITRAAAPRPIPVPAQLEA